MIKITPKTRLHSQNTAVYNQLYITLFSVYCKDFSAPSWECKFELTGFVFKTCAMDDSAPRPPTRILTATTLPSPSLPKLHLVQIYFSRSSAGSLFWYVAGLNESAEEKKSQEFRLCKSSSNLLGEPFFSFFFFCSCLSLSWPEVFSTLPYWSLPCSLKLRVMSSEWGVPKISTSGTSGSCLIWGIPHSSRTLQKAKYPLEWPLQNTKCPLKWALQNAKCPLEWAFCFLKCTTICGGQIPLDNVPSSYPEKILLVIEEEDGRRWVLYNGW